MDLSKIPFLSKGEPRDADGIDEEEGRELRDQSPQHSPQKPQNQHLNAARRMAVVLLASWGFISLSIKLLHLVKPPLPEPDVYRPQTLAPNLNLCDCGTSIEEALSRNCIYDSLATAWLPPHCRDDELRAEFDRSGPGPDGAWPYYADENGTIPIGNAEIALLGDGERSFWSLRDWHIAHCMFYWEKYIRMRDTGVVMERRFDRVNHARHCRRLVMNPGMFHKQLVKVPVMMSSGIDEIDDGHEHEHEHEQKQEEHQHDEGHGH